MSKVEKPIIVRIQSAEGMKRAEVLNSETTCQLFEKVHELFQLNSFAFCLYRDKQHTKEVTSSKSQTVRSLGLCHGDLLYLKPLNGSVLFSSSQTTTSISASSSLEPAHLQRSGASVQKVVEHAVDVHLAKLDGKIERQRDPKLCRHNNHSRCVHCWALEPFDESYMREHNIKHLSFHAYVRKLMSGADKGKFLALDDISCRIRHGCTEHPAWPKGICSKCQPNAITLNRQPYRHVDSVAFENKQIVERFLNYWRCTGHQRIGFLYGTYEPYLDVPLGIRANVSAIYEPPQESSRDSVQLLLPDDRRNIVDELSEALGLQCVGWIFTDLVVDNVQLGTVKHTRNIDTYFLSAQECIMAGYFQSMNPSPCRYASGTGYFGSKFVTICVTGDKDHQVHMEGYQVSNQCMALVRDNCLVPTKDAPELGYVKPSSDKQYVPDVYYKEKDSYGNEVSRLGRPLPIEYLLVDVPASTPLQQKYTFSAEAIASQRQPFPVENRFLDGHIQDFNALVYYLSQFQGGHKDFFNAINDFHLLIFIATMEMLPMREYMGPLLEALRTNNQQAAIDWAKTEHWATVEQLVLASSPPPSRPSSVSAGNLMHASTSTTEGRGLLGSVINSPRTGNGGTNASGGTGSSSSGSPADGWTCSFCTFLNQSGSVNCEMCNLPSSTSASH